MRGSGGVGLVLLVLGALAGILMIAAELTTIVSVDVQIATCEDLAQPDVRDTCVRTGGEQHTYALVLLGLFTLLMAWGAGLGRSRPAALALVVAGIAVLAIAAIVDLPDVNEVGAVGANFDRAEASPGIGLYLELAGGALAIATGVLALTAARR
jgi:hypothetical protein